MVKMNATLADLQIGETATIRDIDASSPTGNRLLELGFIPGTPITAVQRAPMGDPATYLIRGYRIGLRRSESSLVAIHPVRRAA
ncbi:MAG TPA: FeoA family protein [Candidatus Ozemobacteraceae bacterium]|nr:FeoA family protein [Candidatus Ozemobacteraceae bacterium]